jgi:hypothetical protein
MNYFTLSTTSFLEGEEIDIECTVYWGRRGMMKELWYNVTITKIRDWDAYLIFTDYAIEQVRQNAQNIYGAIEEQEKLQEE